MITLCSATCAYSPAYGAMYVLDEIRATTKYGKFNTSSVVHGTVSISRTPGGGATITTNVAPLGDRYAPQNIEWLVMNDNGDRGILCPSATTKLKTTATIYGDTEYTRVHESDFPYNGAIRDEPYKGPSNATKSQLEYSVPGTIECSNDAEPSITGMRTVELNLQKWWDGNVPNQRVHQLAVELVYRKKGAVTARFEPNNIELHGKVGQYLTATTKLVINTQGGSQIDVTWPDVSDVEYNSDSGWIRGHTSIIAVNDGVTAIDKQLRIKGSVAGSYTISVPVTVTLT